MNHDDPKLTACALDQLSPSERAEIETLLKDQPAAAAEVEEIRAVAGVMSKLFRAELTETLTPRRREIILQAAERRPVVAPFAPPAPMVPANVIVRPESWWQRAAVWQAAAAVLVFAFGIYAISTSLTHERRPGTVAGADNGLNVDIRNLANETPGAPPSGPGTEKVPEPGAPARANLVANANPSVKAPLPTPRRPDLAGNVKVDGAPPLSPRTVVIPNGNEPGNGLLPSEGASIGHRPKSANTPAGNQKVADSPRGHVPMVGYVNPAEKVTLRTDDGEDVVLTPDEASRFYSTREYLNARWQEANSIHEGNTYADLARHFRRDGGSSPADSFRFVMIRCPYIKVDVEFVEENGKPVAWPVPPETRILKISRPYFEPEQGR